MIPQITGYRSYRPINNRQDLYLLIGWQGNKFLGASPNLIQATLEKNRQQMGLIVRQRESCFPLLEAGSNAAASGQHFVIDCMGLFKDALGQPIDVKIIAAQDLLLQREALNRSSSPETH